VSGDSWVFGDRRRKRPAKPAQKAHKEEGDGWIVVEFSVVKCPACNSPARTVKRMDSGMRYHRCGDENCNLPFKSIERSARVLFCPGGMRRLLWKGDR
jgi:hypothetical protein